MLRNILLVDDEKDLLDPMKLLLGDEYRVLTAQNADQALSIVEQESVELVISDQRMPGMTGVELLKRIREINPEIVRLILSAYTDIDAMLSAVNEGQVYRYVIKPWDVDDMRITIHQALEWKDLRASHGQMAADLIAVNRELALRTLQLERAHQTIIRSEKMAAVGKFAAEMVHEMNNHLQIILCLNDYLSQHGQVQSEEVETLQSQARMLVEIVSNIRDFSKGAALPFSPAHANPLRPAEEIIKVCQHHPDFRQLKLRLVSGLLSDWWLDMKQIKHLLLNLLKNAAKASPPNQEITLRVAVEDDELRYQVIDHGKGVPSTSRDRIWEPFFTEDRNGMGTGLGLSICRQVAEAHGGTIDCEETPGGGATFTVRIPKKK
jgi:signal transduction histidine kinase